MPPLAKHLEDVQAADLLANWIDGMGNQSPDLVNPGSRSNGEGDNVNLQLVATDPEGDPLTWIADLLPPGLVIDGSGSISGAVAAGDFGKLRVAVTVTIILGGTDTETFTWTVVNLSNNPPLIVDPTIPIQRRRRHGVSPNPSIHDTDGDPLAYSATGLPPGLMIDELIGAIRGTIAPTAFCSGD